MANFEPTELPKLQAYLERVLGTKGFALKMRGKTLDSVEVILNGEFIAVVYKDDEENEVSYDLRMTILEEDL